MVLACWLVSVRPVCAQLYQVLSHFIHRQRKTSMVSLETRSSGYVASPPTNSSDSSYCYMGSSTFNCSIKWDATSEFGMYVLQGLIILPY